MINWKLRIQNKATLSALVLVIISLIYKVLGVFGIVPPVSENSIAEIALIIIDILALFGIIVDPTTSGVSDSRRAMNYDKPSDDK